MSGTSVAPKLVGLVVAMGFLGLGPGAVLIDEVSMIVKRNKQQRRDADEATVAPPGEESSNILHNHQTDGISPCHLPPGATVSIPRKFTKPMNLPPGMDIPHYPQQQPFPWMTLNSASEASPPLSVSTTHESNT
jgi:hypothetical protein